MKKTKRTKNGMKVLIVFSLFISFICYRCIIKAVTNITNKDGDIKFESDDKAASNSRTWRLRGFVIRLDKCSGFNSLSGGSSKYVIVKFSDGNVEHKWYPNEDKPGYNHTEYLIKEDYFLSLLKSKGKEKLYNDFLLEMSKEALSDGTYKGGTIYLNGIFGVYDSGVPRTGEYYTLNGIKSVGWSEATNKDFEQYFNIAVPYKPTKLKVTVPVTVEYQTSNHELMKSIELDDVKYKSNVSYTFPETYNFRGKEYMLYRSYYINMSNTNKMLGKIKKGVDGADINDVKKRKVQANDLKGLKIIAMYKTKSDPKPDSIPPDQIDEPYEEPTPEGEIRADQRGNEQFDVSLGIPTTENVYTNVVSENYVYGYYFNKYVKELSYTITATKTYNMSWTEKEQDGEDEKTGEPIYKDVTKTDSETVTQSVTIKRWAAYWGIDDLKVYALDFSTIENQALQNKITMDATNVIAPTVLCQTSKNLDDHFFKPQGYSSNMSLSSSNLVGSNTKPSIPSNDIQECVEALIGEVKVKNDKLVFNNQIIVDNRETLREGPKPTNIPESPRCTIDDMYKNNITIPKDKANGEYDSVGLVSYKKIIDLNSSATKDDYDVDINSVIVHTPTICDAKITDLKAYNQKVTPEIDRSSLILDKSFTIRVPTEGDHNEYPGYGYRDYSKYIQSREVMFPFDVYRGNSYIAAGNWIEINADEETYYLPTWVKEDNYEIQFRARAINCDANNALDKTEYLANYILDDYVAIDTIDVNVSGRLYDLQIYDITDYPTWENVFRKKDSLELTGTNYKVGINDQNGILTSRQAKYTFPLVNGSHPKYKTVGAVKLGYCTRFKFKTIGDLYNNDNVKIVPEFYYVDKNGKNRQKVDLYYTETFEGQRNYMVKVGSTRDKLNTKSYMLGDKYWQVPDVEIVATSFATGLSQNDVISQKGNMFSFGDINLNKTFRTFSGNSSYTPSKTIPGSVDPKKVVRSVQNWYGEYYIPSNTHVLPKGYDLSSYIENHREGIDFSEDIWLKKGYIIINFDIVTYQEGNDKGHLSYINKDNALQGYCNMWKIEGPQLQKTDNKGNIFNFKYGDYIMYYTDKSAGADYISGGTH